MKFTVNVSGADSGFIERLTAAANRKLAGKLKHLAARHAHAVTQHAATHHAAIAHAHATSHHSAAPHAAAHHSPSHPAIGRTLATTALRSLFKTGASHASSPNQAPLVAVDDPTFDDTALDANDDSRATTISDTPSTSPDGAMVFDVSLEPTDAP